MPGAGAASVDANVAVAGTGETGPTASNGAADTSSVPATEQAPRDGAVAPAGIPALQTAADAPTVVGQDVSAPGSSQPQAAK